MSISFHDFFSYYKPDGEASDEKFEDIKEVDGYVPMVRVPGFSFPLLLCNIDEVDPEYVGWCDIKHGYKRHNLVEDVANMLKRADPKWKGSNITDLMFSTVKDWSNTCIVHM